AADSLASLQGLFDQTNLLVVIPSFVEADSLIEDSLTLDVVIPCLTSGLIRERDDGRTGAIAHGLQCGGVEATGEAGGGCGSDAAAAGAGGGTRRDEPQGCRRDRSHGPADVARLGASLQRQGPRGAHQC